MAHVAPEIGVSITITSHANILFFFQPISKTKKLEAFQSWFLLITAYLQGSPAE